MKLRRLSLASLVVFLPVSSSPVRAAVITEFDSTQPRGFNELLCIFNATIENDQGQDLCPVEEGFGAPQRVGEGTEYHGWSGMMMANATRIPSAFNHPSRDERQPLGQSSLPLPMSFLFCRGLCGMVLPYKRYMT